MAEDDRGEGRGSEELKVRISLDPGPQLPRHPDLSRNATARSIDAEGSEHEPELEPSKPAAQRRSVIHQVPHLVRLGSLEIRRGDTERPLHKLLPPALEDAAVPRSEEPLVWVDHKRVGMLAARQHPAVALQAGRR